MFNPGRWLGTVLAVAVLSGCAIQGIWNDTPAHPKVTTAPHVKPVPDERTLNPYTGKLAADSKCVTASKALLGAIEVAGSVGGAITYPQGIAVKSNARWWTVVVRTRVDPFGDYDPAEVDAYRYYASDAPSNLDDDMQQDFTWTVSSSPSVEKALACLKKVPPIKVKTPRPSSPADTYTGRLAPRATCKDVSAKLLERLEQVGQVGGAITYPRGRMVRANKSWWTVAVATKVNPNSAGYTRDNVAATALFVTDAPSHRKPSKAVSYFPVKNHSDSAATKALACLKT